VVGVTVTKWDLLYQSYPELFKDKDLGIHQSCMAWGVECGEGWFDLIKGVCFKIKNIIEGTSFTIRFTQIKEKFGTLRIYYRAEDLEGKKMEAEEEAFKLGEISGVIELACLLSGYMCEICGKPAHTKGDEGGWYATICDECEAKRKKMQEIKEEKN